MKIYLNKRLKYYFTFLKVIRLCLYLLDCECKSYNQGEMKLALLSLMLMAAAVSATSKSIF